MARRMWMSVSVLAVMVAVFLVATSEVSARPAGQLCPTFSKSGLKYDWETVGTGFTCQSAKVWLVKLIADRVAPTLGKVALHNGPVGLHCYATLERNGHASG